MRASDDNGLLKPTEDEGALWRRYLFAYNQDDSESLTVTGFFRTPWIKMLSQAIVVGENDERESVHFWRPLRPLPTHRKEIAPSCSHCQLLDSGKSVYENVWLKVKVSQSNWFVCFVEETRQSCEAESLKLRSISIAEHISKLSDDLNVSLKRLKQNVAQTWNRFLFFFFFIFHFRVGTCWQPAYLSTPHRSLSSHSQSFCLFMDIREKERQHLLILFYFMTLPTLETLF